MPGQKTAKNSDLDISRTIRKAFMNKLCRLPEGMDTPGCVAFDTQRKPS